MPLRRFMLFMLIYAIDAITLFYFDAAPRRLLHTPFFFALLR